MSLQSMTGFSRLDGQSGRYQWSWAFRAVNGKGLDIRLRLPQGYERLEVDIRRAIGQLFARGNIQAGLTVQVGEARIRAEVNREILNAVISLKESLASLVDPAPLKFDTLLSIRGIVDFKEEDEDPDVMARLDTDILSGLERAARSMQAMRHSEGRALEAVLRGHVDTIERLIDVVEQDPSRQPEPIREKIETQLSTLMDASQKLDRDRLYAELALLATKADIREEIDRLRAHVTAARILLGSGGPVGRKLDFLSQEFNRESNTICSKSNSAAVTAAGIELKVVIDQFREQVQNLE